MKCKKLVLERRKKKKKKERTKKKRIGHWPSLHLLVCTEKQTTTPQQRSVAMSFFLFELLDEFVCSGERGERNRGPFQHDVKSSVQKP